MICKPEKRLKSQQVLNHKWTKDSSKPNKGKFE